MLTRHALLSITLVACKGAERPRVPAALSATLDVTRAGSALRGVASDGTQVFSSFASTGTEPASALVARRGDSVAWTLALPGTAGEIALTSTLAVATIGGRGSVALTPPLELRGDPAAVLVAANRTTGAHAWRLAIDSTQWALVTSLAPAGDDILVGGSFDGTLRIGDKLVSSAGGSDGFVARVTSTGQPAWVVRVGGAGADAVQGVSASGKRIAIAGTFSAGAELRGIALPPIDERVPFGDAFVAELDASGARKWSATFGSRADDAVAGVAIDAAGRVAVAATVHDVTRIGSQMITAQGPGDGLVVWYGDGGELGSTATLGGADFDGLRGIAAVGTHVVVGGFFSGTLELADRKLTAGGGDDAFLAILDAGGTVSTAYHVGGAGREDITSLSALPGGFIAGISHTADLTLDDAKPPAPADPATGAAIIIRGY